MMRFHVVLTSLLLLAATAAAGHPSGVPKTLPPNRVLLDLGALHFHLFHQENAPDEAVAGPASSGAKEWSQPSVGPLLSMGPLHAQFGRDDNPRAGLSVYKSQGMDQLGGSMWEDEAGRSAKLLFVWPTDK